MPGSVNAQEMNQVRIAQNRNLLFTYGNPFTCFPQRVKVGADRMCILIKNVMPLDYYARLSLIELAMMEEAGKNLFLLRGKLWSVFFWLASGG